MRDRAARGRRRRVRRGQRRAGLPGLQRAIGPTLRPAQPNTRPRSPPGWNWYLPFGLDTPAKIYALWFQRYMHRYGLDQRGLRALHRRRAREHAATNPNAWFYKRPITLEDHQSSRWIVEPILRMLDCCQESDGGVAIVVTT